MNILAIGDIVNFISVGMFHAQHISGVIVWISGEECGVQLPNDFVRVCLVADFE